MTTKKEIKKKERKKEIKKKERKKIKSPPSSVSHVYHAEPAD
jgi:hypothetical protein